MENMIPFFFPRSVVFHMLPLTVLLWTSNKHWVDGIWFSSRIFLNGCLCIADWLTSRTPRKDLVSTVSAPTIWKSRPLRMERILGTTEAGSHHPGRLFPRCVTLSNPLPPRRVIHIGGDNACRSPDTVPATQTCSIRRQWFSRYRHFISQ